VAANLATSNEYEAEANRLRAQIRGTGALRSGLTPSNLASEAASRVGVADLSWGGAFDYASKRHPVRRRKLWPLCLGSLPKNFGRGLDYGVRGFS
jgi:hypothetical protein